MTFKQVNTNFFVNEAEPKIRIPEDTEIVFVSDLYASDHLGGAELTTEALLDKSPFKVFKCHSRNVTLDLISQGTEKYWIFGNFFGMDLNLIPTIVANVNFSVIEYDYKFCKYRSQEKHKEAEGEPCNCNNDIHGKIISSFYYAADSIWWMSQNQMNQYHEVFPFLKKVTNTVLSSMFSESFFSKIQELRDNEGEKNNKWIIVGSTSWIKGVKEAEYYCENNNMEFESIYGVPHKELLDKFASSKGYIFLPKGGDTCPRTVIEAKLLGCELILNKNVQHSEEDWFKTTDIDSIVDYLKARPNIFWKKISDIKNRIPTISGYITTFNCIDQDYPFEESIESLLGFCDQVVVVDGGSTDNTWEKLKSLDSKNEKLIIHQRTRDWDTKRFAVFDGLQKAFARSLCTGDFCWQQDSDEVVHPTHYELIKTMTVQCPKNLNLIALPVIEYWGSTEKVRMDVNPWKWRLSRNRTHITHGIPKQFRQQDENNEIYASLGTDGCDYIDVDTFEVLPCANFYDVKIHEIRLRALEGHKASQEYYENWMNNLIQNLPGVFHFSWFNIDRKIKTYKNYWSKHWQSLYNIEQEDTVENNMFFDKCWSDVTNKDIENLSKKLAANMGGWIFHKKLDFSNETPYIDCELSPPENMKTWIERNRIL